MSIDFETYKPHKEEGFSDVVEDVFLIYLQHLPDIYRSFDRTIPFSISRLVLSHFKIKKKEANWFLKQFWKRGYVSFVKFRGVRLEQNKIIEVLEKRGFSPDSFLVYNFCSGLKMRGGKNERKN